MGMYRSHRSESFTKESVMLRFSAGQVALIALALSAASSAVAAEWGLEEGTVELQSAGSLAFGPDGILFVGDAKAATVYAIDTGLASGNPKSVKVNVEGVDKQIATTLSAKSIAIGDMAVNPLSGDVFFSVTSGDSATLVRLSPDGKFAEFSTKKIKQAKVTLPEVPEDKVTGRRPSSWKSPNGVDY